MNRKMFLFSIVVMFLVVSFSACSESNPTSTPAPTATPTPNYISFQEGVSSYTGTSDSEILANNPNQNWGGRDQMRIGYTSTLGVMRALIRFDISSIPSGSVIEKAKLTVRVAHLSGATNFNLRIVAVETAWLETDVTWNRATDGVPWIGGDLCSFNAAMPALVTPTVTGVIVYEIKTHIVQEWLDNPLSNKGLAFITDDESMQNVAVLFAGEGLDQTERPLLEIEYY